MHLGTQFFAESDFLGVSEDLFVLDLLDLVLDACLMIPLHLLVVVLPLPQLRLILLPRLLNTNLRVRLE